MQQTIASAADTEQPHGQQGQKKSIQLSVDHTRRHQAR